MKTRADQLLVDRGLVDTRVRAQALATQQLAVLDAKIAELHTARDALRHLSHACSHRDEGPCPIIAAFDRH